MKNISLFLTTLFILVIFGSCSDINQKEKAVVGAWSQNLVAAKLYFDMKSDKTFEAYAQSNLAKTVIVCWKGSWKLEGDELTTDISEGPTLVTGLLDAKVGKMLDKIGIDNDKIAFSAKIAETSESELKMTMLKGMKIKWSKATEEVMERLRKKQSDMN